ncbi:MAG: alpha/beta hydrolase, partial [bacterium]|nr:alpha/beta hydrolase [bacterium]
MIELLKKVPLTLAILVSVSVLWCFPVYVHGQTLEKIDRFVIGEVLKFKSDILGEERVVFVNYPRGYNGSLERFPVLYVLGGARGFPLASTMVRFLTEAGRIPPMIVVGVSNTDPMRDLTPGKDPRFPTSGGGGERFIRFLKKELIPRIDKNYRTLPFRILAGHSLAGLLATYIMCVEPRMFNAYITSSPWLEWRERSILKRAEELLKRRSSLKRFYYFAHGDEKELKGAIFAFKKLLERKTPRGFKW